MPTARDATIAIVQREIAASAIVNSFALVVSGKVFLLKIKRPLSLRNGFGFERVRSF
jgi:hypothetical protein